MGAVLGISVFVALLGAAAGATEVTAYHRIWFTFAALSLASGAVLFVPRFRRAARPPVIPASSPAATPELTQG
jgi:hypothetical protein